MRAKFALLLKTTQKSIFQLTLGIDGERSRTIKITEAIPKYASGKEVMGYGIAFKIQTKTVKDAQATITLNDIPVFVEEE